MAADLEEIKEALKNKRHFAWRKVLFLFGLIPHPIRYVLFITFASITPDVPVDLKHLSDGSRGRAIFLYGLSIGWIICFCLTVLITMLERTWRGNDPNMIYLSQDRANLFLYCVICPIYVGLCAWMIHLFLGRRSTITALANQLGTPDVGSWSARFPFVVLLSLLISVALINHYVGDVLRIQNVPKSYWFMTTPSNGQRYLNAVGTYYVMLNFGLMMLTVATVFCFFSLFFETVRVAHGVTALEERAGIEFDLVRQRLSTFSEAYIVGKLLCADYIVNLFVWHSSLLGRTGNFTLSTYIAGAMGLVFVSFPRYYVELEWQRYERRFQPKADVKDLRNTSQWLIAWFLDTFFIYAFISRWGQLLPDGFRKTLHDFIDHMQKLVLG